MYGIVLAINGEFLTTNMLDKYTIYKIKTLETRLSKVKEQEFHHSLLNFP